ncbi:FAD-binding molybdopterin dehydrogenase, partial [Bradyrhizobium sp. AT1]|uniref:FAD binding domain-containing protein n=1 Tax=Bradyrhizobium sp. AT1 TaxID=574934 RepID=UPI00079C6736
MRPFSYQRATDPAVAVQALSAAAAANDVLTKAAAQPLAGGTTLIDLMKLDVMRPAAIVDINPLAHAWSAIEPGTDGLRLGALAKMSNVAAHDGIQRHYPVIANSLKLAASAQLRNMATLGGNVMQRTRCSYFRDVSYENCNKRNPGSGCAAMDGVNRMHAVLGVSDQCIATYPGDFAQALVALDAMVEITGRSGTRNLPFAELHKAPGNTPDIETTLKPGELISAFSISGRWPRSVYLKARDRQSYEFALSSA